MPHPPFSYIGLTLFIILLILLIECISPIELPTNIEADNVVLYSLNVANMPDQQFNIPLTSGLSSIQTVVFGINQYKLGDRFYY